ncbi:MAG: alpha/beta fold hydrolase [Corynebacteriales bacterium]|nr:alpha/beta fold hydrolase [Mycobacteriales bacterium]
MPLWMNVVEAGQGDPVVFLHGLPFSSQMWAGQRHELSSTFRVITPDLRGQGATPAGQVPPTLQTCADDVVEMLNEFELDKVAVVAFSMGGYVAMELLRRHPGRVRGLVLAATRASADGPAERRARLAMAERIERDNSTAPMLGDFLTKLTSPSTQDPALDATLREWINQAHPAGLAWTQRAVAAREESFDVLSTLDVPALVIVGEDDVITPLAQAHKMADVLPDAVLVALPHAGHLLNLEQPKDFNSVVHEFLIDL